MKNWWLTLLNILIATVVVQATHIVGGDINYRCLGNNKYEFTLNIYRDCLPPSQGGGSPGALQDDELGYFSIYQGNNFFSVDSIFYNDQFLVPTNFSNECITNPPATCLSQMVFKFTKTLPVSTSAYTLLYQRCCRNNSVNNLVNPGGTGATFSCVIPPNICNTSAKFKNYPPQIICVNNPFFYDHSAIDTDGDSLTYEFCNAFDGGDDNSPNGAKPKITDPFLPQIFSVNYRTPFSAVNPMGGNPPLKIDASTGLITGTPNILGRYVITVCCHEWRNGVMINTVRRDFQFVIANCSKAVVANIPVYSEFPNVYTVNCKSLTVKFDNVSTGGFRYFWDFGVPNIQSDTSDQKSPTFTYPDTGTYKVTLLVNKGSTCPDSISRIVKVYPSFQADFTYTGLLCPEQPISFQDLSTTNLGFPNFWSWNFDDGTKDNLKNPVHSFPNIGKNFKVTLISGNDYGCRDTVQQIIPIPYVNVQTGSDTSIVKNTPATLYATGAATYEWQPSANLNNPFIANPVFQSANVGYYDYIVKGTTAQGCVDYDSIKVAVTDGPYILLPNAFSPNGDGINDVFKILYSGYKRIYLFKVFDRWGNMIFSTADITKGWDGFKLGRRCDIGTYFWMVEAVDVNNKTVQIKGDVTLIE